ncbi:MAG: hypothetical protein F3743_11885 [Nitrospinae bacterium]|nr:hypothetical protein [Nitrospinota bacterium]MZH06072.1 hypothetical protein [Nitrospinota bacterium]MZH14700.1 hypothetical protein [Nitrospinota bacterium]
MKFQISIFAGLILFIFAPQSVKGFDGVLEGRFLAGSSYVFDSPTGFKDFDSEAEIRIGVLGNAWTGKEWQLDYEISADANQGDGPSIQSGLRDETKIDFFRAWLRLDRGDFKLRGGRQKMLFGAGAIYRPLGFFDTRDVTGVFPQTRGADAIRATWFPSPSSLLEGWLLPAKKGDALIVGVRGETLIGGVEAGWVAQYHPRSNVKDLIDFKQEIVQLGYHLKGEKEVGLWNESRLDIEMQSALRFDTVLGTDYTFDLGEGLHVLLEYFLTTRQKGFTLTDPKGQRTIQQIGFSMDQPVGIDIRWQIFNLFDLRDKSFQMIPQIEYSITESWFLYLTGRAGGNLKTGKKDGRLNRRADTFTGTESTIGLTVVGFF